MSELQSAKAALKKQKSLSEQTFPTTPVVKFKALGLSPKGTQVVTPQTETFLTPAT